jgi:hypothetical protein
MSASFALYAWLARPEERTSTPQPHGLGTTCFPTFLTGGIPRPDKVWNNIGHPFWLGEPDFASEPAPSLVMYKPGGWPHPVTATFQGFILDDGAANDAGASVTNGVVVEIVGP